MIAIFVVSISIWTAYDAHKHRISIIKKQSYSPNTGWAAWLISCLLLWIFTFPYYLVRRSNVLREKSKRFQQNLLNNSVADELLKLKQLFDQGVITQEEFNELKSKQLDGNDRPNLA